MLPELAASAQAGWLPAAGTTFLLVLLAAAPPGLAQPSSVVPVGEIREGDLVSIIGPSGCGKSTFLRCLNCLEYITSGTITIAGVTVRRSPGDTRLDGAFLDACHEIRREVGMVFQAFNLFPHRTVLDNVILAPMTVKGESRREAEENGCQNTTSQGLAREAYPVRYVDRARPSPTPRPRSPSRPPDGRSGP